MSQAQSFGPTSATAPGNSGMDTDGVCAVIDHFSGKKPPPLPRIHAFEFRALLHAQRRRLLEEMHEIMTPADVKNSGNTSPPPIAAGVLHTPDIIDAGMMTIIRNNQQLQEIDVALARLSDGTYAICVYCGGDIDRARLKLQPAARYCLPCQLLLISPVTPA